MAEAGANAAAPWEGGRPRPPFREIATATFAAKENGGRGRPPSQGNADVTRVEGPTQSRAAVRANEKPPEPLARGSSGLLNYRPAC